MNRTIQQTVDDLKSMIAEYRSHVVDVDSRSLKRLLLLTRAMLDVVEELLAVVPDNQKKLMHELVRGTVQELNQELERWNKIVV